MQFCVFLCSSTSQENCLAWQAWCLTSFDKILTKLIQNPKFWAIFTDARLVADYPQTKAFY